ncbi:MAG: cupredoxin domain-containing protein [Anaerolineae bacterium]|nr:cupredoxin domain-containing protein [Anaerolineae bacterium]
MSRKFYFLTGLLMMVALVVSACGGGGGGGSSPQTINVEGGEFFYKPPEITAKPGESIKINFKNVGTVEHTFVIKDLNFKLTAAPGATVSGTFKAPAAPGTLEIHCDVAGHTEAGMQGKLDVVAATN